MRSLGSILHRCYSPESCGMPSSSRATSATALVEKLVNYKSLSQPIQFWRNSVSEQKPTKDRGGETALHESQGLRPVNRTCLCSVDRWASYGNRSKITRVSCICSHRTAISLSFSGRS